MPIYFLLISTKRVYNLITMCLYNLHEVLRSHFDIEPLRFLDQVAHSLLQSEVGVQVRRCHCYIPNLCSTVKV